MGDDGLYIFFMVNNMGVASALIFSPCIFIIIIFVWGALLLSLSMHIDKIIVNCVLLL